MRLALTVFFALHVLSASLALGLPWVLAWADRRREALARGLVTITLVNLSATVVLGVAALLFISVAWPRPFVTAAVALFFPLMSVVPLLSVAFAALYAYQIRHWRPGPAIAGLAVLGVAVVFTLIGTRQFGPGVATRLAHVLPVAFVASGVAIMIRFAGLEEARFGARMAFVASLVQVVTGVWAAFAALVLPHLSHLGKRVAPAPVELSKPTLVLPIVAATAFVVLLGVLWRARIVTRFMAWSAATGLFLVVLSMAVLREALRVLAQSGS